MQALKENEAQDEAKPAGKSAAEEVDLGYIDLFEPGPAHYRQAHTNKKRSSQWYDKDKIANHIRSYSLTLCQNSASNIPIDRP
jgi:hypothetical protein